MKIACIALAATIVLAIRVTRRPRAMTTATAEQHRP